MATKRIEQPPLAQFATLGNFTDKLEFLASIAEPENWYYDAPNAQTEKQKQFGVLFQYIHHTFARAQDEGKVLETDAVACFNTGLFTPGGEEIYAVFTPNERYGTQEGAQPWFFTSFYPESSRYVPSEIRDKLPPYVDYFAGNPQNLYFDPTLKIVINIKHIVEDNFDRLPDSIKAYPLDVIQSLFINAELTLKRKISRNNRLAVPQYYNKQIMYLVPLHIAGETIPLAVEREQNSYRINTIVTKGMAYCNARLVMKPESNWLCNA